MIRAIVIGRARGVWEEVQALQEMATFDAIIVVGKAAIYYPSPITHWVTFHSVMFPKWAAERKARGYPDAESYWTTTYKGRGRASEVEPLPLRRVECSGGSSGLVGVVVALDEVLADRVVLAGIPMENERGHVDEDKAWDEAQNYRQAWIEVKDKLTGRVRSMSGWTMELLGGEPPTREWLGEALSQ